ncbi:MAG TPA: hypothetical protein VN750_00925 [Steroidobacteraceae bacterium]|nr:hypothetical protein [Steroidobacteraceae bacterium]
MSTLAEREIDQLSSAIVGNHAGAGPIRTLMIVCRGSNDFDVFEGERYVNRLTWDEMLGHVATLTHPAIPHERQARGLFGMQDADRYQRIQEARRERQENRPLAEYVADVKEAAGDAEGAINARAAAWRAEQESKT